MCELESSWLVILEINSQGHIIAVGDSHVIPGFLTPVPTKLSFQSHRLLLSHSSAEVGGEKKKKKKPERKIRLNRVSNS